jgi:site-specific DNA recombinase
MKALKNQNKKLAAIYVRVSTKEQVDEGNSLKTQLRICREYAAKNGYEIDENAVFVEEGESAKTAQRTQLQKMFVYCAQKKSQITAIIVYKIDRLSRNTDDYSQIRLLLKKYNIEIKSTSEHFEDNPAGRFMENMIANVAQFDNDVRAERCSNGMKDAIRDGRYVWMAPIGYSNVQVLEKATIAPNKMAPMVRKAFELVATGLHSVDDVWRIMKKEGLLKKNGQPVGRGYFHNILRNVLYAGWIEKFGERHKGLFKAIISDELFAKVQYVLKNKGHKVSAYKTDNPDFPLRRFVFSPSGLKLTGSWSKGNGGKYAFYRFGSKGGSFQRDEFERRFIYHMDSYQFDDEEISKLKKLVQDNFYKSTESDRKGIHRMEARLKELTEEEEALIRKNLKGVLNDDVLKRSLANIDKARFNIQADLATMRDSGVSPEEAVAFAEEYLASPSSVWRNADIATQTKLQWFQFPSGIIFDGQNFETKEVSSVFKAKELILAPMSTTVDPTGLEPATPSLQMRCSTR